jgi:hypothetical protein
MDESILNLKVVSQHAPIPWYARLWAAVMRRAAVDWVLYRDHDNIKLRRIGTDADAWIFSGENSLEIGSFESVCSILNIPSDVIQGKITNMTETQARNLRGMEFGDEW